MLNAENALLTAKAQQEQAEAQLTNARNNFSFTEVRSPADGVVGTLPHRVGTLVSPQLSQPLTTVSDNSQMYVYFSILMTALTMIFGLLPLMFATGVGANGSRALASGAVGGMLVGTLVLLFIVPALFIVFQALQEKFRPLPPFGNSTEDWAIQAEVEEVKEKKRRKEQ